jgi:hypothetical protein
MSRLVWTFLLLLMLSLAVAAQPKTWSGSWSANAGNDSRAFGGTWDATLGDDPETVLGNWTMLDQSGATLAAGTWSARKDERIWKGSWQARLASGQLYSGTWQAQSQLRSPSHFSELFEFALTKAASGAWHMGNAHSGGWSIRTSPGQ